MGVASSSPYSLPPQTVVFDLYMQGQGCGGNSCEKPSFERHSYNPALQAFMTSVEFDEFKRRMGPLCSGYKTLNMSLIAMLIVLAVPIPLVLGLILKIPAFHVPFMLLTLGGIFALHGRVVSNNTNVDAQVQQLVQEFNLQHVNGRASLTYFCLHTGFCKPKHARIHREIWIGPYMTTPQFAPGYHTAVQMAPQSQPVMGQPMPVSMQGAGGYAPYQPYGQGVPPPYQSPQMQPQQPQQPQQPPQGNMYGPGVSDPPIPKTEEGPVTRY